MAAFSIGEEDSTGNVWGMVERDTIISLPLKMMATCVSSTLSRLIPTEL